MLFVCFHLSLFLFAFSIVIFSGRKLDGSWPAEIGEMEEQAFGIILVRFFIIYLHSCNFFTLLLFVLPLFGAGRIHFCCSRRWAVVGTCSERSLWHIFPGCYVSGKRCLYA